ncbi:NCK-interacting protein with SH3 domain [Halyomorpha halys]|uniref:NCK-interacting protein with SH3 domain n=1 Tax=Halyomorpha halys TaxID=286706 RepID=UPI0006D4F6D0|nr:NCK-interacting protein with SH3 domain [Halyomorpha halys]
MDNYHKIRKEEYEMLQAMYDFTATIAQTLSFKRDEYFIFHSNNNIKKNWWYVINSSGKVGYIPSNYVATTLVNKGKCIEFLSNAIENLSCDISKEGGTDKQLETMKELISKKQEIIDRRHKSPVAVKEKLTSSKSLPNSQTNQSEIKVSNSVPEHSPLVMRVSQSDTKITPSNERNVPDSTVSIQGCNVTVNSVYSLIQMVRCQTGLSHEDSRIAVGVVAEGLLDVLPSAASPGLEKVLDQLRSPLEPPSSLIDKTQDAILMRKALKHLTAARDDAQQRSWALWDDEAAIRQSILDLSSILTNADPIICKRVLKTNEFSDIIMLVDYYQMEERTSIRQLLIQAFAVMCCLDLVIISLLLNSVLPMELAREMQSNVNSSLKLHKPAMLLAMILSSGEAMPITHLDQLGIDFIKMILEVIELEANSEIGDTMLSLILSYNLQFKPKSPANITIQAVSEVHATKNFTEKVLLLINREVDPVLNLKTPVSPCNSVLKLLMDLFENPCTAELFYTNDVRVLIDIIVRQLTDLPPKDQKRTNYLELCKLVLTSCDPLAFEHRLDELKSRFCYILTEEIPQVDEDKNVVREIAASLPKFFGESLN